MVKEYVAASLVRRRSGIEMTQWKISTAPLNLAGFGSGSGSTFMLTELDDVTTFLSTGCLVVKNPIETFSYWTTVISYFPEVIDSLPDFCGYIMTFSIRPNSSSVH